MSGFKRFLIVLALSGFIFQAFPSGKENRFTTVDPQIIKLSEKPPYELVLEKKEYLIENGLRKLSKYNDSTLKSNFGHFLEYDFSSFFCYSADFSYLSKNRIPAVRKPMQDPVVFAIAVSAIEQYPRIAKSLILKWGRYDHIYAFSDQIKEILYKQEHLDLGLLCLCRLTESEKKRLLKRGVRNLKTRAALGDTVAENRLVMKFEKADAAGKSRLAKELGYVGSEKTLKTLVEHLDSPLFVGDYVGKVFIRLYFLVALSRAYPNEPLFQEYPFYLLSGFFDEDYPKSEFLEFMDDLKQWAIINYNVELNLNEDNFKITPKPKPEDLKMP